MQDFKLNQNQEVIFSDEAVDIIIELVKKYGLEKVEKEMEKKISQTEIPDERRQIFENLPTCQISRTVKETAEGKISFQECVTVLRERLEISQEEAEKLAKDLKEKVLILAQGSSIKEKVEESNKEETVTKSAISHTESKDIYRELIE